MLMLRGYLNRTSLFVRFLLVGVVNTFVGLSVMFFMLHAAHLSYWWATFSGNAVGALVSFLLNRSFTFRSDISVTKGAFRFFVVMLLCYYVAYSFGQMAARLIVALSPYPFADVRNDLAVLFGTLFYTVLNYLGQKIIVFAAE
jgi:putative flippase GtrA